MPELNAKRRRFVVEYLIDQNATQAAIRAGYSAKTAYSQGHDLLKIPEVISALEQAATEHAKAVGVTVEGVLRDLREVVDRCMQTEEVLDREGNPTGEYAFKEQGALKGLELIGKHLRMFVERVEATGANGADLFPAGAVLGLGEEGREALRKLRARLT